MLTSKIDGPCKNRKMYMTHLYMQKDTEHRISLHYYFFIIINIVIIDGVALVLKYICVYI